MGLILLAFWLGGIVGGAVIAIGSGQNKGWTVIGALMFLTLWPLWVLMQTMYLLCGAKMDSLQL